MGRAAASNHAGTSPGRWQALEISDTDGAMIFPGWFLVFAELCFAWTFIVYIAFGNEPIFDNNGTKADREISSRLSGKPLLNRIWKLALARGLTALAAIWILLGTTSLAAFGTASVIAAATFSHTLARWEAGTSPRLDAISKRVVAETELFSVLITLGIAAVAVRSINPSAVAIGIPTAFTEAHLSVLVATAALLIFVTWGGTHVVRGILEKSGATPHINKDAIDEMEYARGRVIGALERILLVVLTVGGHYEALGFLAAAKGLIRSNQLKQHDYAEYFLVGTLASTLVAVAIGLLIKWLASAW
jgi:uncharacterized protein YneF (UPF0154 family)